MSTVHEIAKENGIDKGFEPEENRKKKVLFDYESSDEDQNIENHFHQGFYRPC